MKHYVGLDVSMKETFVCIEDETGKVINQGRVKTDPDLIAEYLKKFRLPIEKVGIESGSLSHWLVEELRQLEIPAICIDARKMAAVLSVQVNKTTESLSDTYKVVFGIGSEDLETSVMWGNYPF